VKVGRSQALVFAALLIATVGAFFVAQRLKHAPTAIGRVMLTPFFSPTSDGRFDRARLSFRLEKSDDVTVRVESRKGDTVATLADNVSLAAYHRLRLTWDGRTSGGGRAPDGAYRLRVNLRRQGRSILLPRGVVLDTTPPRPRVTSIGPTVSTVARPEILPVPGGGPARISVQTPSAKRPTEVLVYRTAPSPGFVTKLPLARGGRKTTWDGTVNGRKVRPGTYAIALRTRDRAGNIGSAPTVLPPHPPFGTTLPGRGGITVRYLGVASSLEPTVAGTQEPFGVDARRRPYTFSVRRVGTPRPRKRGRGTRPIVRLQAPNGVSGLYLFSARSGSHVTSVPFPVQATKHSPVLVVLPAILWQGANQVDDDGDGWPNTLTDGLPVARERVLAGGLPDDLVKRVAPLLIFLDRSRLRYDLTTDLALAAGDGPQLAGHRGVVLAGDERWLPKATQSALRSFVRGGGRLASFGIDSLRRQVRLTARRLLDPTAPARTDAFGAVVRESLTKQLVTLTNLDDKIGLFSGSVLGGTGRFTGVGAFEETVSWPGAQIVASAVTDDGRKAIVAARVGRGLVIRFGVPGLPGRLNTRGNETELVLRTWKLLAG